MATWTAQAMGSAQRLKFGPQLCGAPHSWGNFTASPSQRAVSGSVPRKAVTTAEAKLDSRLLAAVDRRGAGATPFAARDGLEVDVEQRVLVDMTAAVTPGLIGAIEAGGGVVVSQFPRYGAIRARTLVEALIPLAERNDVRGIRPADRAVTR